MNWISLCRMGAEQIVGLAVRGKLKPSMLWVAFKGATRYLESVAAGDKATDFDADERVTKCDLCRNATYEQKPEAKAAAIYCGPALEDHLESEEPQDRTCGCLVGVLINGSAYAGGKTQVASEACPQAKWEKVEPA
jgi:hypothetical protein